MLKKSLKIGLALFAMMLVISSCKKEEKIMICEEPIANHCEVACDMEPVPDWCPTGAPTKYFFNKTTGTCEGVMTWYEYPFETLADCEACSCTRLITQEGN